MYTNLGPGQMIALDASSPNGVDLLSNHAYVASRMLADNLYQYTMSNPLRRVDPSGLACQRAVPPSNVIPEEDLLRPTAIWKPTQGYRISITRSSNRKVFKGAKCKYAPPGKPYKSCTMDIEIRADAYRYFRNEGGRTITHTGALAAGVSNDPRDFFSLVVFTICRTNICCHGKKLPDATDRLFTRPLQKNGLGVFIRQGAGDIETTLVKFRSKNACQFAKEAIEWLETNTTPGEP